MNRVKWCCESCGKSGQFEFPQGWYTIRFFLEALRSSHDRLSPECTFDVGQVQLEYGGE